MADTKISGLGAATVTTADETVVNEAGTTKKVTLAQIQTLFAASQTDQENATPPATVYVTPGVQNFHPSACKFWVKATANSTTIVVSYNMTSWADTATGQATGTIATDFSGVDWCGQVSVIASSAWDATYMIGYGFGTQDAGTFRVDAGRVADGNSAVAAVIDPTSWYVMGWGDQ